jgi:hypothetical protein
MFFVTVETTAKKYQRVSWFSYVVVKYKCNHSLLANETICSICMFPAYTDHTAYVIAWTMWRHVIKKRYFGYCNPRPCRNWGVTVHVRGITCDNYETSLESETIVSMIL